jgi:ribonuclease BN (tRNA processing enzyme)
MKLTFLGTGGAFERSKINYHNNALLEIGDNKILIDCSLTALESLDDLDIDPLDIDGIIVTHIHGDHVSGLEELGFRGKFLGPDQKFDLMIHPDLLPSHSRSNGDQTAPDLWENTLKGGMMHIQDEHGHPVEADLETFFRPHIGNHFIIEGNLFNFIRTNHVPNKHSFGLRMRNEDSEVFFTADARPLKDYSFYESADTIFHDCMFMPHYDATVHTHLEELKELPEEFQDKMYLMHYGDPDEWEGDDHLDIARKHQTFEF